MLIIPLYKVESRINCKECAASVASMHKHFVICNFLVISYNAPTRPIPPPTHTDTENHFFIFLTNQQHFPLLNFMPRNEHHIICITDTNDTDITKLI